jgi:hypothetical protein
MRWAGHIARMGEKKNVYRILMGKPEGKRPLGRRCRWVDNIKMDLREREWDSMDWIGVAQDRDQWRALVNTLEAHHFLNKFLYYYLISYKFIWLPFNRYMIRN